MVLSFQFGSATIEYKLEYSNRKSLGITISPDLAITVKAPIDSAIEKIKEKLRKKAPWIIRQQNFFLSFHPMTPPRKYVGGETHLYLGRQYRLKITDASFNKVMLKGRFIEVYTQKRANVEKQVKEWYLKNAKSKFEMYAAPHIESFQKYKVHPSSIIFRDMPTRWGSCTPKGKIILNPELIKAPKGCIEYVIIHELCHLVYPDHTNKFIELQSKEMPDWQKWKMKLEHLLA